ncbi:PREDICTED: uncharacterized protein LOC105954712 [Erythranthe guttata]|uniref:uncharacterized protein LOC105954712 n=1 Tax=Erythranthe guttata TaxID=4155 RepID=UPI00064D9C02|nr:PREDICTED: uncharacterized protein LOC105954712 [Erythranthe guttata]|eukprot:XP_012833846.1 PREDICTED: uncharacterized protein LOC105954712 [Erythranthe guttata]
MECRQRNDWPKWEEAIKSELTSLEKRKVVVQIVQNLDNVKPIWYKWIFVRKRNENNKIVRYKHLPQDYLHNARSPANTYQHKQTQIQSVFSTREVIMDNNVLSPKFVGSFPKSCQLTVDGSQMKENQFARNMSENSYTDKGKCKEIMIEQVGSKRGKGSITGQKKLLGDAFKGINLDRMRDNGVLTDISNVYGSPHSSLEHVAKEKDKDDVEYCRNGVSTSCEDHLQVTKSYYESNKSCTVRNGKKMTRSHKTIDSVTRMLDMTSVPAMLVDEDLQTLRDNSSDSGDSEYVSNDENSDDSVDDTDYEDLGDQTYECPFCGSMMWYGERIDKHRQTSRPKFGLCCMSGKVQLPKIRDAPPTLNNLVFGTDRRSKHFQENVRSYNMMFSFMSLGGKVQISINNGSGPYTFLLHGHNYHILGSLLPEEGTRPKLPNFTFSTQKMRFRIELMPSGNQSNNLDPAIVASLKDMIDGNNILAQHYRVVRDRFSNDGHQGVKLRLVKSRSTDGRTYNLPNASEITGLIVGDFDTQEGVRDIVVETRSNKLQRISELHPLYLPLQYPILFPYGEDGYRDDISLRESSFAHNRKRREFYVDGFSMVESQRLNFIRFNQDQLRVDMYKGIEENIFKRDTEGKSVGQRIIIPGSFTAGPRYMFNNFVAALQICNWIGFPILFITITCNPQWPEIQRVLKDTNLRPEDRPDILCRVFKMKLDSMMTEIKKGRIFGRIRAYVCTIEFQKRGLSHAHILLWLHNDDKPKNPEEIDRIICAEIPDEENDRKMYQLVEKYMIHGPCGQANLKSPCMKDRVCTKRFPKPFVQRTESDADGFTVYRRREDGRTVTKNKTTLDNGFVVPYNRILLSKYRAHINIELCNQNKSIKYLFKYVNKGHGRVTAAFYETRNTDGGAEIRDEIKMYYDCRYLSACEAMWRLFNFDIHYRDPSVIRLSFHLPDHQLIVFNENQSLQSVLDRPSAKQTMFLAWFEANKNYPHARDLRYGDFPQKIVYKEDSRTWVPRKKGFSIGRIANVPLGKGEDYYLRLLLNIQRGCTCYEDIRKVFDIVYPTFRDACYVLGLLDDYKEYIDAIKEVNTWASGDYIRRLFAVMLLSNSLSRPEHVWQSCWLDLADGIAYKQRLHKNPDELDYDRFEMGRELQQCLASITDEQRKIYDVVMDAVTNDSGGMFFLYGHGGTGKTFLWKTLSAAVRSNGEIVINVASSGRYCSPVEEQLILDSDYP